MCGCVDSGACDCSHAPIQNDKAPMRIFGREVEIDWDEAKSKASGAINDILGDVKIPKLRTENEIGFSPILIIGLLAVVLLLRR